MDAGDRHAEEGFDGGRPLCDAYSFEGWWGYGIKRKDKVRKSRRGGVLRFYFVILHHQKKIKTSKLVIGCWFDASKNPLLRCCQELVGGCVYVHGATRVPMLLLL